MFRIMSMPPARSVTQSLLVRTTASGYGPSVFSSAAVVWVVMPSSVSTKTNRSFGRGKCASKARCASVTSPSSGSSCSAGGL